MSSFYFCFFLLIFVFKVLGYPIGFITGRRASPERHRIGKCQVFENPITTRKFECGSQCESCLKSGYNTRISNIVVSNKNITYICTV